MGKLYNRADLERQLALLDRLEEQISAQVANGDISPMRLLQREHREVLDYKGKHLKWVSRTIQEAIDAERQACRMRLLQSGSLMLDLRASEVTFEKCPCGFHEKRFGWMKKRVKDAGDKNMLVRLAEGGCTAEEFAVAMAPRRAGENGPAINIAKDPLDIGGELNETERLYYGDRREGRWPFQGCELDYGLGYVGWLTWRFESGRLEVGVYRAEKARLGLGSRK